MYHNHKNSDTHIQRTRFSFATKCAKRSTQVAGSTLGFLPIRLPYLWWENSLFGRGKNTIRPCLWN